MDDRLSDLMNEITRFRDEREWMQFHTPKNLAAAISIEAAELQELFLWKADDETEQLSSNMRGNISHEIADVMIYAILLAHRIGVNPSDAIRAKLKLNGERYPVEKARGNAQKYTAFEKT